MDNVAWLTVAPLKNAIGWTIVHSIWQLTLITLVLYLALRFIPRKKAELRYTLLLLGLTIGLFCSGYTFAKEWQSQKIKSTSTAFIPLEKISDVIIQPASVPPTRSFLDQAWSMVQKLDDYIPLITFIWLMGALLFSLYLLFGLGYLKYLEYYRTSLPGDHWQFRLDQLSQQMGVKRSVRLFISETVNEPITFQLFKPVIMVPIFFFTGLTPAQAEVLLLHELAHIRRYDFTVNLFQSLAEILFFFHPAIWWLSAHIREEREYCCDNAVLAIQETPFPYVEALTRIQSTQFSHKNRLAMSANGNKSMLSKRVFRLFGRYEREPSRYKSALIAFLLLAVSFSAQAFLVPDDQPVELASLPILEKMEAEVTPEIPEPVATQIAGEAPRQPAIETSTAITPGPIPASTPMDTLPLFIIDGVKKSAAYDFKDLDPDEIKAINVLKDEKAIEKYGKEGQFGVIEISTKRAVSKKATEAISESVQPSKEGKIRIKAKTEVNETIVKGTVTDENGQPLIGTSVLIKGTKTGTITDLDGTFELRLPEDCVTLVFAYIGKETTELENVCAGVEKVLIALNEAKTPANTRPNKTIIKEDATAGSIISGQVLNGDNAPVIGANILIKGTTVGTISDMQGNFRLQLTDDCATLLISYIGMETKILEGICGGKDLRIQIAKKQTSEHSKNSLNANPPLGIGQVGAMSKSLDFKVFPNPSNKKVNISFKMEEAGKVKLSIYTTDGKLIKTLLDETVSAGIQQFTWDVESELKGTFPVILEIPGGIARQQLIIE